MKLAIIQSLKSFYRRKYKAFIIVPIIMTLFSILIITSTYLSTGAIVAADIELKGGIMSTLDWAEDRVPDLDQLQVSIASQTDSDIVVRTIHEYGSDKTIAITVEAESHVDVEPLQAAIADALALQGFELEITPDAYSTRVVGPAMGEAFLDTAKAALAIGFIMMSLIILFAFKNKLAAILILLSALLNVTGAIAAMNIFAIKLSPATIAALLMILGYSVDSNILITTAVIRKKHGDRIENVFKAVKTGMTMVATTIAALTVLGIVSNSQMLSSMAAVLLSGLIFDISNTWFMNLNVLLWSEEKKHGKAVA